jgi:cell division protein FtsW (lipid II flippase)
MSCLAFIAPVSAFLSFRKNRYSSYLLAIVPLMLALWIGTANAALCYGIALGVMVSNIKLRKHLHWVIGGFIVVVGSIPLVKLALEGITSLNNVILDTSHLLVLYDYSSGANAHTELVLSHITYAFGIGGALIVLFTAIALVARLFYLTFKVESHAFLFFAKGFAGFLAGQIFFSLLVSFGIITNPASGVTFPFVSYSGSLLITEMALIGAIFGLIRRTRTYYFHNNNVEITQGKL